MSVSFEDVSITSMLARLTRLAKVHRDGHMQRCPLRNLGAARGSTQLHKGSQYGKDIILRTPFGSLSAANNVLDRESLSFMHLGTRK